MAGTKLISCWSRTDVVGAWRCQSAYEDVSRGCRKMSTRFAELPRRMLILSYAIWFARDQRAQAPWWAPTVDKRCSAVLRGLSHEGRLIGGGACNQEPDGDTRRRDSDLDRFGPCDRRNTLRHVSLVYCIEMYVDVELSTRGPLHLLIYSGGVGLQEKYHIWYYTISWGARRPVPCTPLSCGLGHL